jgi:hypothetical protein
MVHFQTKKSQFGSILEGVAMEDVGIFYDRLVYFTANWYTYFMAIWYILWSFGILFPILLCCTKKNLATLMSTVF